MFVEYLSAFASASSQVFSPTAFGLMVLGVLIGFAVGILPGLGGPTALALMLPFTFTMSPVEAFSFLLGMLAVTSTTGDITSILFGVPGEATAAAAVVDGHPMAKKGEAGRALGAALMSSLVGAIFGAICLVISIPFVRPLVLSFGSPEFFMVGILGVTFVVALSGNNLIKGLVAGGLGFYLATVGMDPMSATQRYTFDLHFLWDGIGLVPVAVGLFAIPEVIDLAIARGNIAKKKSDKLGGVREGVRDTFRHFWLVMRCSALGAYIGTMPGMGAPVAQWVAYAHAVQSSPDKKRFGKGAVEGVLGPGAACNSIKGGELIPTIAFGLPGSISMAILLGAFIVQGMVPGPDMLLPPPKGHLDVSLAFVLVIVLANLITVGICFLFLNQLAKITDVRGTRLIPFLIILICLGGFAEKNAMEDLMVVLFFGLLGWVFIKLDWPRPPLLLGLVLGPLMENRLFLSTDNYGASWLWRPGVLILAALAVLGICYPLIKRRFTRAHAAADDVAGIPSPVVEVERGPIRRNDIIFTGAMLLVLAIALWQSKDFGFRAGLFPWVIGFPMVALLVMQLGLEFAGKATRSASYEAASDEKPDEDAGRRTAEIIGWIIGFFLAIWLIGFVLAVPVATVAYLIIAGREKWPTALVIGAVSWAVFYGLFVWALDIPFAPPAILGLWS
jgi:TctA family transporter